MNLNDINARALELGKRTLAENILTGNKPDRFLFVTISGAHLYGFPSPDSDIDLRGAHLLPLDAVIGLREPDETYESKGGWIDGLEVDCVSHDLLKYFRLLANKNGYVLEQIFSPLVVHDGGHLQEIRALAKDAMTRHVVHHYKGFFRTQEKLTLKDEAPTVKAVLYLFRVVMTGLHLLRSGEVEANIETLNGNIYKLPFIPDLIARKRAGAEFGKLKVGELEKYMADAKALEAQLEPAFENSSLPESVQNYDALNEFVIRMRKQK
jgi:uncharacterized protein